MPKIVDYARFADRLAVPRDRWALLREVQDEWGYPAAESGHDDPRVLVAEPGGGRVPQARSISDFFVLFAPPPAVRRRTAPAATVRG
ncbi:hypothetical protein [Actinomadura sp. WAC 06369]|uniref:hypothetical protein n=1 Tax=Actinomadura sp. WAC 06369 TaxID=2203193 RepID=UPI000F7B369B|nr:hypothetical protein [Actinomadura sp. WAC 06369]RSN60267.1 hypothetical protein DMH08_20905 [Actinomadura sp. WAC 06369]